MAASFVLAEAGLVLPFPAEQAEITGGRAQLVRLRRVDRILALGYSSRGHASKDRVRTLEKRGEEQGTEVSVYRQEENERPDALPRRGSVAAHDRAPTSSLTSSDLGEAEVDELGGSVSAFSVSSSRARRTVRQAWAAMARVMWRCQPG